MPTNSERCGSVLRLGERVWKEYRLVLSLISNSKFQCIQTAGIRGPQFQFRIPALNVYFQKQPKASDEPLPIPSVHPTITFEFLGR
jgi:hypothetical protein